MCPGLGVPGERWLPAVWHGDLANPLVKLLLRCLQVMACQCYLNFVAVDATAASCPRTGVCTHALDLKQVTLFDIGQDFRY